MSEQDNTATTVVVGLIIAIVVGLMLWACCAYSRYRTLRARKDYASNADLVAESCFTAMAGCVCCFGECSWRAGKGASDAAVSAVGAVKNGTEVAVTESASFWWFTCHWLGWLLRYVFCCCCYDPRDGVPASEANAGLSVGTPVAVPILDDGADRSKAGKGAEPQPAAVQAVPVEPPAAKPQGDEGQPSSESASVTTPLLALAV
jgi:hypothetical protein